MLSPELGHVLHTTHRRRCHEQGGVVLAVEHQLDRLRVVAGVAEAIQMVDLLVGHPQRALEQQRLGNRRVEASVGLGAVGHARRRQSPGP